MLTLRHDSCTNFDTGNDSVDEAGRKAVTDMIAAAAPRARTALRRIRALVRKAAPDAEEVISYGMPSFRGRRIILHYAAFSEHIGIFPPLRNEPALQKALAPYAGPKGNLRFPLDEPMPWPLIERLVKARVKQDGAAGGTGKKTATARRNPLLPALKHPSR
jgi:uncharacterized protein YdhG (YjbR/CyaY superfamily)